MIHHMSKKKETWFVEKHMSDLKLHILDTRILILFATIATFVMLQPMLEQCSRSLYHPIRLVGL